MKVHSKWSQDLAPLVMVLHEKVFMPMESGTQSAKITSVGMGSSL